MLEQRVTRLVLVVLASAFIGGCTSNGRDFGSPHNPPTTGSGAGGAGGHNSSAGTGANAVPDTPCELVEDAPVEVYPLAPDVHTLATVGARLVAAGTDGYVTFDADGGDADDTPVRLGSAAHTAVGEGQTASVFAADASGLWHVRMDDSGDDVEDPQVVSAEPALSFAATRQAPLTWVFWGESGILRARFVNAATAFSGAAIDVVDPAYTTAMRVVAAPADDGTIGVAWTGDVVTGARTSFFVRMDANGPIGDYVTLWATVDPHQVVGVVSTPAGFVVLSTAGPPDYTPTLIVTDPDGAPLGEARPLEGARVAHGLVRMGTQVAVLAGRDSGELQLREFDESAEPAGPWVCLAEQYDGTRSPALTATSAGATIVYTTPQTALMLQHVDGVTN